MTTLRFFKGHGTENDFVIVPDFDGALELGVREVVALCDRRAGIGADGVLRVVRSAKDPAAAHLADEAEWFMDYRNSDGSAAEMCGNGARVFGRFLVEAGEAAPGEMKIATRGGVRTVRVPADGGDVTIGMGPARLPGPDAIEVTLPDGSAFRGVNVSMGNPHAVVFVDSLEAAGDLLRAPALAPAEAYPEGANVEFVVDRGPGHVEMRVHERGSGETRSCGTGACAVMVATARRDGAPQPSTYTVDVPGGRLVITERADGEVEMTGPAVIVAEGEVDLDRLTYRS